MEMGLKRFFSIIYSWGCKSTTQGPTCFKLSLFITWSHITGLDGDDDDDCFSTRTFYTYMFLLGSLLCHLQCLDGQMVLKYDKKKKIQVK
ncbi:hypothetical protein Hdeb2414_s0013g00411241 [Helianthus debilis subsp. tardiflorus]